MELTLTNLKKLVLEEIEQTLLNEKLTKKQQQRKSELEDELEDLEHK